VGSNPTLSAKGFTVTRQKERRARRVARRDTTTPSGLVRVNVQALAPNNSYGVPDFVKRGYYEDVPFVCKICGSKEIWRAAQQKWWYEVAKGYAYSGAKLCRPCRRRERTRRDEARRVHLEGLARKRKAATGGN
jgi:hypothetical protein